MKEKKTNSSVGFVAAAVLFLPSPSRLHRHWAFQRCRQERYWPPCTTDLSSNWLLVFLFEHLQRRNCSAVEHRLHRFLAELPPSYPQYIYIYTIRFRYLERRLYVIRVRPSTYVRCRRCSHVSDHRPMANWPRSGRNLAVVQSASNSDWITAGFQLQIGAGIQCDSDRNCSHIQSNVILDDGNMRLVSAVYCSSSIFVRIRRNSAASAAEL